MQKLQRKPWALFRALIRLFIAGSVLLSTSVLAYPPPGNVENPSSSSSGTYLVHWTPVLFGDLDHYRVYESKNGGAWVVIGYPSEHQFQVVGRQNGSYRYQVVACPIDAQCSVPAAGPGATIVSLVNVVADLTATPSKVPVNGSSTLTWSSSHAGYCTLDGQNVEPNPSSGLSLQNIAATTTYTLICGNPLGDVQRQATVEVIPAPVITNVSANPAIVPRGQTAQITWNVSHADSCTVNNNPASVGSYTTPPMTGNQTFAIYCSGVGGNDSEQITLESPPAPTIDSFGAIKNPIGIGKTAELYWTTSHATSCTLNTVAVAVTKTSHLTVPLSVDTNFTLACSGVSGDDSESFIVEVKPETVVNQLAADANPIASGQSTTVRWDVAHAQSCTLNGNTVPATGNVQTGVLTATKVYRLVCTGLVNDIDESLAVNVNGAPTITSFYANQNPIATNTSTTLNWTTTSTLSCSLDGNPVSTSGSVITGNLPGSRTYRLSCGGTNNSNTVQDYFLEVTDLPVATLGATYLFVEQDSGTELNWTSGNANACVLDGVSVALNGSQSTGNLSSDKTYTLLCSSTLGQVEKQITITVLPLQTLWRDIGRCDPRTGKVQQRCGDSRGCVVNDIRVINGSCAESTNCQP